MGRVECFLCGEGGNGDGYSYVGVAIARDGDRKDINCDGVVATTTQIVERTGWELLLNIALTVSSLI
ncbi:unnamed protein product [Ilex paraguariensis]|uniref:RNase H type-1 domain-containing protein n=1 Tax=Ilex paraguariensis TaxID=185542 RepID=A0ABC8TQW0_9AQUA